MKIALLVRLFPPVHLGGTELATYNIAKHLAIKGHEVHVITSYVAGMNGLQTDSKEKGFDIHRIKMNRKRYIGTILNSLTIVLILKKIRPDIVHSQNIGMGIASFLTKIFNKIPYVVYSRGDEVYKSWLFNKHFSKIIYNNADAVIALNKDMKREMKKTCHKDILVIPNGIDLEKFSNISKDDIRKKIGIKNQEKIIIFVGRFHYIKGIKYLIDAIKLIIKKEVNTKLLLIGSGEDMENIKRQVKTLNLEHVVQFLGKLPHHEVPNYMTASDVFVLPSLMEGFPNTVLEAMASGLPIVATNVGGISEIIIDNNNGFLVNPRNPIEIAEKVMYILKDEQFRKNISLYNKEYVQKYTWEDVIQKLEEVYVSVTHKSVSKRNQE